eukprot:CAMPEP_0119112658 /NCGR_PEP_ID=MMETSP1180-20130426/41130_1 /TAXON_ID=3052 ORGANISM="Chlamydomonas cf sp, Strain CCMP681" /NCGR_SAMPLE_ID=MMETSP1180 /ASSEMBLY_ACC=CAM_ASM_000741 /LENGTH=78 /DNA_ID=CAMNT_0007100265 /DNA_START=13 /DNA_END=246 /DNA_ORIENTATION=+
MITKVRGFYIKSGQVLATKREYIPASWVVHLASLWDEATPRPWKDVRASISKDLASTQLAAHVKSLEDSSAQLNRETS